MIELLSAKAALADTEKAIVTKNHLPLVQQGINTAITKAAAEMTYHMTVEKSVLGQLDVMGRALLMRRL